MHEWHFPVMKYRVWDGDSQWLWMDTGFRNEHSDLCRIFGIDAPEKSTDAGKLVTATVDLWLSKRRDDLFFNCIRHRDKYGRPLGTIYQKSSGEELSRWLINNGLCRIYLKGAREEWPREELDKISEKCKELMRNG